MSSENAIIGKDDALVNVEVKTIPPERLGEDASPESKTLACMTEGRNDNSGSPAEIPFPEGEYA